MAKMTLGYWDFRARGAAARMMLEYGGQVWEDKAYPYAPASDPNPESWFNVKQSLGLDFPNLPYLIDGDVKLTESWAIFRYIGRKVGLAPVGETETYKADMLEGVIESFMMDLIGIIFQPNFGELKAGLLEKHDAKLAQLEKFLGCQQFLTGSNLRYVDFAFFQPLDQHRLMFPGNLDKFPKIKAYLARFEATPKIAAFMKSPKYYVFPIFPPMANWGVKKQ